ncbi:MAG: hydroxymethylglutaryl-CoA reductase, degradative [Candidatus Bathyarchaeota archaeon]|nr:hydroxymethylglutaryl-CoA reductase, degradative [Candidatus Bathyarchaeota archaeon]MDH5791399.1 hydroxymethylglutaryl-CoA reductase, degradative [Candidatus Bathyarchaeota archaeon]
MASDKASSRISGYYKKTVEERVSIAAEMADLTSDEVELLRSGGGLGLEAADRMIENVVGTIEYPLGVAVNFRINGRDRLVPMAIEEPSVVAAASNMARLMREGDGIKASCTDPVMIGQIQVLDVPDMDGAKKALTEAKESLLDLANQQDPVLVRFGGGARDLQIRVIETEAGEMLVLHLLVDCRDAMGANAVNTMCEVLAPSVEKITGGRVLLRIISNLADHRLARAEAVIGKDDIGGEEIVDDIVAAWAFADADPYRAATHNKGIMNGVIAVALATAQDHRALEAGAHAYAARSGRYRSLSRWSKNEGGDLVGVLEMPMAVGIVGGATRTHPVARLALKIMGASKAIELAGVMAAVGLAQNLGALRALVQEGIQHGHMRLHARNLVVMAGAEGELIDRAVEVLVESGEIRFDKAQEIVRRLKG